MSKPVKVIAVTAIIAGAAGYLTGVLTAPKSGKETRQDIKDVTERGVRAAEKVLKHLYTELNEQVEKAKVKVAELHGRAKEKLESAVSQAGKAKDKVREVLSAAHDGEATDQDLKNAINEAEKAVENLKAFLQK